MRRGFTLIELLIASTISGIVLSALIVAMGGLWRLAKESNEELQVMMSATARREQLLTGAILSDGNYFIGLYNITNWVSYSGNNNLKAKGMKSSGNEFFPTDNDFTRGESKKNSKGVSVTPDTFAATNAKDSYGNYLQDVTVYLWVETPAGSYCRMPVRMTVLSQDGTE